MPKVVLAYEYEGHKPDDTIDVDDFTARTLIREGRARPTPQAKAAETRRDTTGTTEKG